MNGVPSSAPDASTDRGDADGDTSGSLTDRLLGLVDALRRRLRDVADGGGSEAETDRDRAASDSAAFDLQRDGYPDRERPLTYPGRERSGVNTPDVVGVETEDGLRLSVPENPDATVVSDVWVPIEE
jgi:hypothetical protein